MSRIADPARTGTIAQFSIDQAGNTGADITFGHETDAKTEADKAFNGIAVDVTAFNSGAILGRDELGYQNVLKLVSLVALTEKNGFVTEVGPIDSVPVGQWVTFR